VIERAFGIDVLVEGFGDGFDGLACSTTTFRLIIVNSRTPWSRQRFTLFHEWGHILLGGWERSTETSRATKDARGSR
jgi:Zn-dependent peptidase ImmA (M78 family)